MHVTENIDPYDQKCTIPNKPSQQLPTLQPCALPNAPMLNFYRKVVDPSAINYG